VKIFKKAILPIGFQASGISCGIKKSGKPDLALFYSNAPAKAACLFTANKIPAAPIVLNKERLKKSKSFQAIIANSGNANAFTGVNGLKDSRYTAQALAKSLGIKKEYVLVASTGIIGKKLPVEKIKNFLTPLIKNLSRHGINPAQKAIMTTDTFAKEVTAQFKLGQKTVTICGIAKGAGMIAPNMATMLCFLFTDAAITQGALKDALKLAVENSFNCITVDGCMSTNDSVMLLANGQAQNRLIEAGGDLVLFALAMNKVCMELAKMVVRDGEGANKFIRIRVLGAKNFGQAKTFALSIANSNLFKTAIYGENPNYGRIVSAVGACGIKVKEMDLKIKVSPLAKKDVFVDVCVGKGAAQAVVYTSDLTPEYIKINAEYN